MSSSVARARSRRVVGCLSIAYLVSLTMIVFWPHHVDSSAGALYAFLLRIAPAAFPFGVETTLNVVLLVPFGWILPALIPGRPFVILGLAWAVPLLIEIGQGVFLPGRTSSAIDVAANTVGGLLGALSFTFVRRLRRHARSRAPH